MRGYHKPIMIAGGVGNIAAAHSLKYAHAGRRAADPARRPGHADRHGRRRGLAHGYRHQHRGSRFRFGAARQRRDPAPRAGSHRSLLAAGRGQSDPVDPRRRRGRPVQCAAGTRARRRRAAARSTCARSRPKSRACRRRRSGATRRRSATCWPFAPTTSRDFSAMCERERCPFAVVGTATGDGSWSSTIRTSANMPVDMDLDVLLGKPPKMTRDVVRSRRALPALDLAGVDRAGRGVCACCTCRRWPTRPS